MAIYTMQTVSRSTGHLATTKIAYNCRDKITDIRIGALSVCTKVMGLLRGIPLTHCLVVNDVLVIVSQPIACLFFSKVKNGWE